MKFLTILKNLIIEEILEDEEYYSSELPKNKKEVNFVSKYEGKNIVWYGVKGRMAAIPKENIVFMEGNIWYNEKLEFLKKMIRRSPNKIELECAYAIPDIISLTDIIEEQKAEVNERFSIDYDGTQEPASIGDEELDQYIGEEDIAENDDLKFYFNLLDNNDLADVVNEYKMEIAKGRISIDDFKNMVSYNNLDEDSQNAVDAFLEIETRILENIENGYSDIGKIRVQLRDGNHRALAAIETGEYKICVNISEEKIKELGDKISPFLV